MANPFLGQIIMGGWSFAPRGWADCDGQLLAINQNDALFALLGTIYGGDGRTTFALPDLRGRVPIHQGQGPNLTARQIGFKSGSERQGLTPQQLPVHKHTLNASQAAANSPTPVGHALAEAAATVYVPDFEDEQQLSQQAIGNTGGGQQHDNTQPFQVVRFVIALVGIYPSPN